MLLRKYEVSVRLTWPEILYQAAPVGCARNVQALAKKYKPGASAPMDDTWTFNIEGACGELAVAKHLKMFWSGNVGNPRAPDVGPYEVRTNTSRRLDDMILRDKDMKEKSDRVFISVLSFAPEFIICGWYFCCDAKEHPRWKRAGSAEREDCWFVPRDELHPLHKLPSGGRKRSPLLGKKK